MIWASSMASRQVAQGRRKVMTKEQRQLLKEARELCQQASALSSRLNAISMELVELGSDDELARLVHRFNVANNLIRLHIDAAANEVDSTGLL
jgi:hypothetical protein